MSDKAFPDCPVGIRLIYTPACLKNQLNGGGFSDETKKNRGRVVTGAGVARERSLPAKT